MTFAILRIISQLSQKSLSIYCNDNNITYLIEVLKEALCQIQKTYPLAWYVQEVPSGLKSIY